MPLTCHPAALPATSVIHGMICCCYTLHSQALSGGCVPGGQAKKGNTEKKRNNENAAQYSAND